eukprot:31595_1
MAALVPETVVTNVDSKEESKQLEGIQSLLTTHAQRNCRIYQIFRRYKNRNILAGHFEVKMGFIIQLISVNIHWQKNNTQNVNKILILLSCLFI